MFRDTGSGDWLGFYDWLRAGTGEVVGVRLWVDEPDGPIRAAAACCEVTANENLFPLVIQLGAARAFVDDLSDDQDFGANRLLASFDRLALTFNAPTPRQERAPGGCDELPGSSKTSMR